MDELLGRKVEQLWAREKIKELTHAYGRCIEQRDAEEMARLFTENGEADFSSLDRGVHKGRDAIKAFYVTTWPLRVKAFFTNRVIEFLDERRAKGTCCFENRGVQGEDSVIGQVDYMTSMNGWQRRGSFAGDRVLLPNFSARCVDLLCGYASVDLVAAVRPRCEPQAAEST